MKLSTIIMALLVAFMISPAMAQSTTYTPGTGDWYHDAQLALDQFFNNLYGICILLLLVDIILLVGKLRGR